MHEELLDNLDFLSQDLDLLFRGRRLRWRALLLLCGRSRVERSTPPAATLYSTPPAASVPPGALLPPWLAPFPDAPAARLLRTDSDALGPDGPLHSLHLRRLVNIHLTARNESNLRTTDWTWMKEGRLIATDFASA